MDNTAFLFSGTAAQNYENFLGPILFEPYAQDMASRIDPSKAGRVLEVAAGTGRVTKPLRDRMRPDAVLCATDINADMLAVAEQKLRNTKVQFSLADAQDLPFDTNSFDYVVCQFGVMFLPDKQLGFKEAFRVLKPGGQFLFNTWDRTSQMPVLKIIFDDILLPFLNENDVPRLGVPFSMHDRSALMSLLDLAGFHNSKIENVGLASVAYPQDIVDGLLLKHSLGKEVAQKDSGALGALAAQMVEVITAQLGSPATCELSAWVGSGYKASGNE